MEIAKRKSPLACPSRLIIGAGIGAQYAECSAMQGIGINELFTMAVADTFKSRGIGKLKRKARCAFM
jgi:hypothetical protein